MISIDFNGKHLASATPMIFSQPSCKSLFDKMPDISFKKGEVIFGNMQLSNYVYLVTKGMVKVFSIHHNKELLEDYLQKGEMLNCQVVFNKTPKKLTAVANTSQTTVKKIPVHLFQQAVKSNTSLYEEVLANIAASLHRAQDRLHRMTLLSSQERVIHFLANHVQKSGQQVGFEHVIRPVLTHQEIGHIAGVGRQTVTTVLNELRRKGIIHFTRRYLIVRDLEALLEAGK